MKHKDNSPTVNVNILNHLYKIKCAPQETKTLQDAAKYLNQYMEKLQNRESVTSMDQIAVVAALNVCSELLKLKEAQRKFDQQTHQRIQNLHKRVEKSLAMEEEIDV